MKKMWIYIDGFNLYYGAVRSTAFKWLNLEELCRLLFPSSQIERIKYFTARVTARPSDPSQPIRQQTYFRALGTLPSVELHFGQFRSHAVRLPLARTVPPFPGAVGVSLLC